MHLAPGQRVWEVPRNVRLSTLPHCPVEQVAVLNAMFTIGAFVTPMLIAASIHFLGGHVWPAYYILAAIAILEVGQHLELSHGAV